MNEQIHDHDWEERLRGALGSAPAADFDAWCRRYADTVSALTPPNPVQRILTERLNRRMVAASLKWIAAASLVVAGILWLAFGNVNLSTKVFADDIPGIDDVLTMEWTTTHFIRWISEDGKRSWIQPQRQLHAYRHPGQYRVTNLGHDGQPISVKVTDHRAQRTLHLDLKSKTATLKLPSERRDERSPFAWVGDVVRDRKLGQNYRVTSLSMQGQRQFDGTQANVVQAKIRNVEEGVQFRLEFLFDSQSKQLVGVWEPNPESEFDPETATDRNNPPEETWSKMVPLGALKHNIVLNPKLDPSDFNLDPPADYTFKKLAKPTVTEEEMVAYLGTAARFNDNRFPDSPYNAYDRAKFNAASNKAPGDRTRVEQAMIDHRNKFMMREIYRSPVKKFEEDQTVPHSFHYLGADVDVGEADRIVAWYKLRNGVTYRGLFGDFSVRDLSEDELPLRLSE